MTVLKVIPTEYVPQMWDTVAPWIGSALEFAKGDYELEHVRVYLTTGQWVLIVAEENDAIIGAAAIQFFNRPTSRVAFVVAVGANLVANPDTFMNLKEICKIYGATHIEGAARESIARLWRRFGFEEKYRIVEVKL
jgi:hypothetical protein